MFQNFSKFNSFLIEARTSAQLHGRYVTQMKKPIRTIMFSLLHVNAAFRSHGTLRSLYNLNKNYISAQPYQFLHSFLRKQLKLYHPHTAIPSLHH